MASFSTSSTLKMILVSTGVLTVALALKHTVPVVSDFIVSECPSIWTFMLTCLRPPYLYILMNCIIISIVASSKLQHQHKLDHTHSPDDPVLLPSIQTLTTAPVEISEGLPTEYNTVVLPPSQNLTQEPIMITRDVRMEYPVSDGLVSESQVYDASVQEPKTPKLKDHKEVVSGSDEAKIQLRTSMQRMDSLGLSFQNENEKPPVSARFGHRKAVKAGPDGGKAALGVMKAKRQDTLESTWRMITEGRAMPLARHLKKSDTWDSQLRRNSPRTDQNGTPAVKKSETFNGRSKAPGENESPSQTPSSGSGKLKKEPSLGQDELNRRVEAFINKFNEEMRLQRQESLRQYHEMIRRGAH
ncbi:uncharacterized protein LOC114736264 [Neltuma alba]|uniref:uncharacterized protein LOC114736264 n=1 Tax=Neltuma alba TaxID=207710 RepID=UPI0010A58F88|nr:uncharacterized protein LOC114736264 [Prosopis alba]